jgi:hypothetical protein
VDSFLVAKRTGTHADVVAAVGAADVLSSLRPRIVDLGNDFEVRLAETAMPETLANAGPGFKFLKASPKDSEDKVEKRKKNSNKVPAFIPDSAVFDYTLENEKYKRQQAAKKTRDQDVTEGIQEDTPDPDFRLYRILKTLQAESGTNKLVEEFFRRTPENRQVAIWQGFTDGTSFLSEAPLVQLFNPQAAKGYALLKPTGTDRNDKTKEKWAEPFLEWLRYRGYFASCAGWFLGAKGENVRVYCPVPNNISLALYNRVAQKFRAEALTGSAPRLDTLGTLRLARILIEMSELSPPARSIRRVFVTHFQSVGKVKVVTSIEQLAMPDWFGLQTNEEAQLWLDTLNEHDAVLRRLDDDKSEELALLKQYRHFLQEQGEEARPEFISFLAAYGGYVFQQRGQGKWLLSQFTQSKVEAILQGHYRNILNNQGFKAVADALRSATVSAQVAKRRGDDHREIQYGAIPELRRKLALGRRDEFLQAVAEFVAGFNVESGRRYEMGKSGFRVAEQDFAALVELMDTAPPELVGSLLCAIATCKLGKDEKEEAAK